MNRGFFAPVLVLSFFIAPLFSASETPIPFQNAPLPTEFKACYDFGSSAYSRAVKDGIPEKGRASLSEFLDAEMAKLTSREPKCLYYFSVGAFTAEATLQQYILLEYLLEQEASDSPRVRAIAKNYFSKRIEMAGLPANTLDRFQIGTDFSSATLSKFKTAMRQVARDTDSAVPFGRFVFTDYDLGSPLTLYEYPEDESGSGFPVYANQDPKKLLPGSYQRVADGVLRDTHRLVAEYLAWRPGLIYGEDSFLYGAFWRALGWDNSASPREIKEEGFAKLLSLYVRRARELHLKPEPFYQLQTAFLHKQRAVLQREIQAFDRIFVGVCAAPLIPVGMYVGASGLAYAGLSSLTAANTSAMLSLGTMTTFAGIGVKNAIRDARTSRDANLPFRFSDAADHVLAATVSSFPLAAALPAAVGGTAATGKFLLVSGYQLLVNGMDIAKTAYSLGYRAAARELGSLAMTGVQNWAMAWWNNPTLFIQYAAESSISIIFEIGFRQIHLEGKEKFYYVDSEGVAHINEQSLFTIGTILVAGGLTKPIVLLPTFSQRFWTYRSIGLFSSVISQLIVSGKIDPSRVVFDQIYAIGIGMPSGEGTRLIKFSDYVMKSPALKQYLILTLMETAMKFGLTPVRTYLVDHYVGSDRRSFIADVRFALESQYFVDTSEFSDDEIFATLEEIKANASGPSLPMPPNH